MKKTNSPFDQSLNSSNANLEKAELNNDAPAPDSPSTLSPATPTEQAFPEGGLIAWLVVVGGFCVMLMTFGYINAFGVYQAFYKDTILSSESESNIAWIGSIQAFFQFLAGLIAGPITDRSGPRMIICVCSTLYTLSVLLTSVCKELWQFLLCQGVLGGITNGLIYTPAISIIGHYFHRRRVLAMSIVSTGSSLGGVIFPIMLGRMLFHTHLGFGWSVRVVGFLILALALTASLTIVPRVPPRHGPFFLPQAFLNPAYSFQVAGTFMVMLGLLTPFFYITSYAQAQGVSRDLSFYTVSMLNASSLCGRLVSGLYAQKLGRFNFLIAAAIVASILCFCWIQMKSNAAIFIFAILYGPPSGVIVALIPATLAQVALEPNQIGTYIGMAFGLYSIAALVGTPITGVMISTYGGYNEVAIFSGSVIMAGAALLFCARCTYTKSGEWAV